VREKALRSGAGYGEVRWDPAITNQHDELVAQLRSAHHSEGAGDPRCFKLALKKSRSGHPRTIAPGPIAGIRDGRRRPDSVASRVDALDVASFSTASSLASSRRRDGGRAGPPTAVNKATTVTGEWLVAMIDAVEQPVAADGAARLR